MEYYQYGMLLFLATFTVSLLKDYIEESYLQKKMKKNES